MEGTYWTVPNSQCAYPTFPEDATDNEKKAAISGFILVIYSIIVVQTVKKLPKNQSIEAADENYILKLRERSSEYSGQTLLKLLTHLQREYAPMDDLV